MAGIIEFRVKFFPSRNPNSIINMATFDYALEQMSSLTIPVPVLLIGLFPKDLRTNLVDAEEDILERIKNIEKVARLEGSEVS